MNKLLIFVDIPEIFVYFDSVPVLKLTRIELLLVKTSRILKMVFS